MKLPSTIGQKTYGDIAPDFADLTDRVNELPPHLEKALNNGVTLDELKDLMTHLAFYAGWPAASTALGALRAVVHRRGVSDEQQGTDK